MRVIKWDNCVVVYVCVRARDFLFGCALMEDWYVTGHNISESESEMYHKFQC